MIDYKGMDVKNLTLEQMNALIGLQFSDLPVSVAASETNVTKPLRFHFHFIMFLGDYEGQVT